MQKDQREYVSEETQETKVRHPLQLQISEEMEREIIQIVRSDYDASKNHRDQKDYGMTAKGEKLSFDEWHKSLTNLYNARREPKTVPWKFCSNRSLRIATSILDTIHARLVPSIVNPEFLRWQPGEQKDVPKVERITKLMNWWIWVRASLQEFFDIWIKQNCGYGDALTETTFEINPVDTGNTITNPILDEQGNQLMEADGTPAVTTFRDIKLNEKTRSHTYLKSQVFLQKNSCDIQKEPVVLEEDILFRDLEQGEVEGQFVNVSNILKEKLHVEESHGTDISDAEARKIRDMKIRNMPIRVHKEYLNFDVDGDGFPENIRVIVSLDHRVYLGGIAVKNLTKSGKRPIHFQKFDNRLDRPNENDGEGLLEKVKELAEEIDAIFNQLTDSNTLSILRPGFYDPAGDLDAPVLKLAPNKMTPVSDPQRNILFPDLSIQVQQLLEAIRLVLEFVERLTAASSFIFGKEGQFAGGSGTATQTQAIVQSAETRFQRPAERLRKGASEIIKQHLDILQLNIPPGLESRILGEKGEPVFEANELTAEGISGEYDAYMLPDPSMGSKQLDRELSQMFYGLFIQNPIVMSDPAKFYKLSADILKAWDKNPEEYLGPAPQTDDIDDPKDENTLVIQGDFARVRAQITENHLLHIQEHMALMQSPSLAKLPPHLVEQVMLFTQQHIQEHQQMMQLVQTLAQKISGGSGGSGIANGNSGRTEGTPQPQGVEQIGGEIGSALTRQRAGESGTAPQPK